MGRSYKARPDGPPDKVPPEKTGVDNEGEHHDESNYRAMVEAFDGLMYICSDDYVIEFANRHLVERTGRNPVGEKCYAALHDRDSICPWCVNDRVQRGETVRWEVQSPKDGRWYYVVNNPIRRPDGRISKQSMIMDVTEQKEAQRTAAEKEALMHTIVENVSDGILVADVETRRFVEVNSAAARMLGYTAEELKTMAVPDIHPEKDRDRICAIFDGNGHTEGAVAEVPVLCRDGTILQAEIHFRACMLGGRPCLAGVFRDTTQRRQGEERRLDLERRLLHAQKLESLGVLAGGIAHDFNNLLMAIMGYLDLARIDAPPESPIMEDIEMAMESAQQAADLTKQVLAYSGRGNFQTSRLCLSELIEQNTHILRTAVSRAVGLELRLAENLPPIAADRGQMQQLVMNLIANASESHEPGQAGHVVVESCVADCDEAVLAHSELPDKPEPGRYVCLEVRDDGCGMTPETARRVFEPFFSTKAPGRGLGMAAVMGVVAGHNGAIMIDSAPGMGTTVRVLFPIMDEAEPSASGDGGSRTAPNEGVPPDSKCVLVVDDEDPVRRLCCTMVRRLGYKAMSAATGDEALALVQSHPDDIACVLMDLTMPGKDGIRTFREMRRIRDNMPVILSSGYSQQENVRDFASEGFAGFLQKPYVLNRLRDEIARVAPGTPIIPPARKK